MDVQRLRILRELADRGSVTAVAAALSYTPSAISQQLKALTAEVGLTLTEPAGRGLRLTDAGRALSVQAEDVLAALSRADAAVQRLRTTPAGTVRLDPSASRNDRSPRRRVRPPTWSARSPVLWRSSAGASRVRRRSTTSASTPN